MFELQKTIELEPAQKKAVSISGAEAIVKSLIEENVHTIFGYPGGAIMPFYDALYGYSTQIDHILTRHEQGAIHAAQGYARASGEVGVCIATSGPGATNLVTGLADAMIDSTPLVCITGQVPSALLGTDAFQETDVVGISMPVTKWNFQITKAEEIPMAIAKAFYIAKNGRPGPVLIDITKDAQFALFDFVYKKCKTVRSYKPKPVINTKKIVEAAELINSAKKPYILVGQGVLLASAEQEMLQFMEKTGIPAASTLLGLSAVPADHPLYVGYLGMHGNYSTNVLTNECDVLIAVGMRFDDRVTGVLSKYAKQAKVIHIEIDEAEIDKNVKTTVAIHADAKEALTLLIEEATKNDHSSWVQQFRDLDKEEFDEVISKHLAPKTEKLQMAEVVHMLSEKTRGNIITVTDVGQHQMVVSRYYRYQQPLTNITSGGLGTMGFSLPAAMGAQLGCKTKQVVAIIGDGGYQMTIQELGTIMQFKIPVKILILNNHFLGMVRQWQEMFFESRYSFTEMHNPDFVKIAAAYDIPASKVVQRELLSQAMDKWLNTEGPAFLEVEVQKEENVFPMVPSGAGVAEIRLK